MDSDNEDDWTAVWDEQDAVNQPLFNKPTSSSSNAARKAPQKTAAHTEEKAKVLTSLDLNDNKAGMIGLDKEKINRIIMEASKGSRFYENEQRKQKQTQARIDAQKLKQDSLTQSQLDEGVKQADLLLSELDSSRDLSRTIVHVDMDAFYAAVEMRDRPELRDKPMAVGSNSMLSTSNYAARRYGVRAAMPGFIAKKLCPNLILVPHNFDKYREVSQIVRAVFAQYDPNFCPMSLDEAYLDITEHLRKRSTLSEAERSVPVPNDDGYCCCKEAKVESEKCCVCLKPLFDGENPPKKTFGLDAWSAVDEMRLKIQNATQLTASAGIAPNMMLAKVCSDRNKPNGQFMIQPCRRTIMEFVDQLPIRKVSGIGKVSESMLAALDVRTCSDLYHQRGLLYHLFSPISFNYFMRIALGVGATKVENEADRSRKSMSVERTFGTLSCPDAMMEKCRELSDALAEDLKSAELKGKTVTIKLKTIDFEVRTRAQTLSDYTMEAGTIFKAAGGLLKTEIDADSELKLRLMGVRMSNFSTHASPTKHSKSQPSLLDLFKPKTRSRPNKDHEPNQSPNVPTTSNATETTDENAKSRSSSSSDLESQEQPNARSTVSESRVRTLNHSHEAVDTDSDVYDRDTDIDEDSSNEKEKIKVKSAIQTRPIACSSNDEKKRVPDSRASESTNESIEKPSCSLKSESTLLVEEECQFICPICYRKVKCTDLNQFNRHIDSCLVETERPTTSQKASNDSKKKVKDRQVTLGQSFSFSCGRFDSDVERRSDNVETLDSKTPEKESQSIVGSSRNDVVKDENVEEDTRLKCPICNRVRIVDDLDLFNRHIDMCLLENDAKSKKRKSTASKTPKAKKKPRK